MIYVAKSRRRNNFLLPFESPLTLPENVPIKNMYKSEYSEMYY